jgi:glycerol-3-phosphate dehydrogenase
MAADAVDEAARALDLRVASSCTHEIPLLGAEGFRAAWNARARTAARTGVHVARVEHMLRRYGSRAEDVLDLCTGADGDELAAPLPGAEDYLAAEVVYAATHEGARHLEDVLTRRTRISIEAWDRGTATSVRAAELMARILGWDSGRTIEEIRHYLSRVAAERESQVQPDDAAADAVRLRARDLP